MNDAVLNYGNKLVTDIYGNSYSICECNSQIHCIKILKDGTSVDLEFPVIPGYEQRDPVITIDESNHIHVAWIGYDEINVLYPKIKYITFNGVSWSEWINYIPRV